MAKTEAAERTLNGALALLSVERHTVAELRLRLYAKSVLLERAERRLASEDRRIQAAHDEEVDCLHAEIRRQEIELKLSRDACAGTERVRAEACQRLVEAHAELASASVALDRERSEHAGALAEVSRERDKLAVRAVSDASLAHVRGATQERELMLQSLEIARLTRECADHAKCPEEREHNTRSLYRLARANSELALELVDILGERQPEDRQQARDYDSTPLADDSGEPR